MVRRVTEGWDVRLIFEPGRLIVGNAGVLLTRVIRVKPGLLHPFVIVDAAMNDLMRPSLYDAWHAIEAVVPAGERRVANVVGPVRSEEHTSELQSLMRISYAGFCFETKKTEHYTPT